MRVAIRGWNHVVVCRKSSAMADQATVQESRTEIVLTRGITLVGLAIFAYETFNLMNSPPDLQWVWLAVVAVLVVSRMDIHIPKTCGTITLSDTFVFISLALYGIAPSVVLAGVNAAACSLNYSNPRKRAPFSAAIMSVSVYVSATIADRIFGDFRYPSSGIPISRLVTVLGFVALVHYMLSAGVIGAINSMRRPDNRIRAWAGYVMWSSVSYFVGAAAASLVVELISIVSFYGFLIAIPILACTYLTYKSRLDKVEATVVHAEHVTDLHLRTIEALAVAMDAKGDVPHEHVRRVQIYATGLARFFGLSEPELEAVKAGTLLHDIGKLAIPDHILHKPGPLSPAEFERMKMHTVVGAEILERVRFPYPIVPIVRNQHERWDGQGYPDGLRGDQIPMGARILSVADCFDSLREDRRYRKAKSRGEAITLLKDEAGKTFDPEVVRVFLEHLPELEAEIRWQRVDLQLAGPDGQAAYSDSEARPNSAMDEMDRIRDANRDVLTLYNIAGAITRSLDLRDTFAVFSSRLEDIVTYTTCVVYLLKPDSPDIEVAHASGRNFDQLKGRKIAVGAGIAGWVIANHQPIFNCDPGLDFDALKVEISDKYQAAIVVPLLKDGHVLGALGLYSTDLPAYAPDDLRLVEAVAKLVSDAIANSLHNALSAGKDLTDPITGLPNARALRHRFEEEADRARRHKDRFAIVMMDLDGFRPINDQLGHEVGDGVLRGLARLLASQLRSSDFITRYGGDEFVAILHAGPEEAADLVQHLQKMIEQRDFGPPGVSIRLGMSMGCSTFGPDGTNLDELLIAADRAMYADKARRKAAISRANTSGKLTIDQYRIM
jgi:diguanylate cyclase (GGDEF)-like protein/putative nucleotidyltransferase with HDIG domain